MKIIDLEAFSREEAVKNAVSVLKAGGLVVYPTETLYGIGADATNPAAVDKLLKYKRQRDNKPISIAVGSQKMAEIYVELNDQAKALYQMLLPGPFTVVSHSRGIVDPRCVTVHNTLGVRIPDYSLVRDMIQLFGKPITATSANASYKKQPRALRDILDSIDDAQKKLLSLVLDAGELPKRDPSTVLDTTVGQATVLRQGSGVFDSQERLVSNSVEETIQLGVTLLERYRHYLGYKSIIFALQGEMGAGKTHFTKGIARALGLTQEMTSPTFVLSQEYLIDLKVGSYAFDRSPCFYHMDLWRIRTEEELQELRFKEQVEQGNIFAIEWADRAVGLLQELQHDAVIVWVDLQYGEQIEQRLIEIKLK